MTQCIFNFKCYQSFAFLYIEIYSFLLHDLTVAIFKRITLWNSYGYFKMYNLIFRHYINYKINTLIYIC